MKVILCCLKCGVIRLAEADSVGLFCNVSYPSPWGAQPCDGKLVRNDEVLTAILSAWAST